MARCARDWHFEPPEKEWNDLSEGDAIAAVVDEGQSIFVTGIAGTGKSHLIRERLVKPLRERGLRVIALAKTHAAAAVAEGDTMDHFAWKHIREGGTSVDVVWVDEVSMLDIDLLCDLSHLGFRDPPVRWIFSGDFNQYKPFFNSFRGESFSKSFEASSLLRDLSDGNRLTLRQCRRSDDFLFAFYARLIPGGARFERPLECNVAEARKTFHPTRAKGFITGTALAPTNLVISHRLRVELNGRCNQADAVGREGVEEFRLKDYYSNDELQKLDHRANQPQDALFWPGLVVLAYEIVGIGEDSVTVRLAVVPSDADAEDDESETVTEIVLTRRKFFASMRLQYARTYAGIQGTTIKTLLALHDTDHRHFDWRNLFVGVSRAVATDMLVVY